MSFLEHLSPLVSAGGVSSHKDKQEGTTLRGNDLKSGRFREILVKNALSGTGEALEQGSRAVVEAPSLIVPKMLVWHCGPSSVLNAALELEGLFQA